MTETARRHALLLAESVLDLPGISLFRGALDLPEHSDAPDPEAWARSLRKWANYLAPRTAAELLCEGDSQLAGCEPVLEEAIDRAIAGIRRDRAPGPDERLVRVSSFRSATVAEVAALQPIADAVAEAGFPLFNEGRT